MFVESGKTRSTREHSSSGKNAEIANEVASDKERDHQIAAADARGDHLIDRRTGLHVRAFVHGHDSHLIFFTNPNNKYPILSVIIDENTPISRSFDPLLTLWKHIQNRTWDSGGWLVVSGDWMAARVRQLVEGIYFATSG